MSPRKYAMCMLTFVKSGAGVGGGGEGGGGGVLGGAAAAGVGGTVVENKRYEDYVSSAHKAQSHLCSSKGLGVLCHISASVKYSSGLVFDQKII